jgi:ATP-dependent Clp protease ATP-binding subunit ClpC
MFIGKSGCGKTLLAKKIAEEIFGDEKYLVRFDMSEYSDKTSTNKLIGSSAGYVGYDEGGLLTEAIKKKKYAVLLIDEIEKANSEVFNLFLQVLDEGYLTDNTGKKVDFKNTIIILTSNIGTKRASIEKGIGFEVDDDNKFRMVVEKEIKNKFPPEFINRIDEIVYFNTLTDDNLRSIITIELNKLRTKLNSANYSIDFDEGVIDFIFDIVSKEKDYGARPILRAIQNEIENKVVDILIENENKNDFRVSIENKLVKVI